jgi:hypothetical protein
MRVELELLTLRDELLTELERETELLLVLAGAELRVELELLLTLRVEELLLTLRLELVLPELTLRVELALPELTLRLELVPTLTLRVVPLLPDTLRLELELPLLTLRVELVLLGRSYVLPDWVDLVVSLLTERDALERLVVAGATLLTEEELLPDCDTLRVEEVPDTLRLDEVPDTLRLELELPLLTLRFEAEATLRPDEEPEVPLTDLDATSLDLLTLRLLLEPDIATLSVVLRLRLRSHPPLLILRLPAKFSTLPLPGT